LGGVLVGILGVILGGVWGDVSVGILGVILGGVSVCILGGVWGDVSVSGALYSCFFSSSFKSTISYFNLLNIICGRFCSTCCFSLVCCFSINLVLCANIISYSQLLQHLYFSTMIGLVSHKIHRETNDEHVTHNSPYFFTTLLHVLHFGLGSV
jgi:hypothetical protein